MNKAGALLLPCSPTLCGLLKEVWHLTEFQLRTSSSFYPCNCSLCLWKRKRKDLIIHLSLCGSNFSALWSDSVLSKTPDEESILVHGHVKKYTCTHKTKTENKQGIFHKAILLNLRIFLYIKVRLFYVETKDNGNYKHQFLSLTIFQFTKNE